MKINFNSKYVKFVFIMNLIQAFSLAILYLLSKYHIPASLDSIVMTTCLLCVLDILLYERVYHMTKVVTDALGMSKECSPYAEILLAKYPNLTKFIAVAIILLAYGFILMMDILFRPTSIVALYIPLVVTASVGIDFANDWIMCRWKYHYLFYK